MKYLTMSEYKRRKHNQIKSKPFKNQPEANAVQ